MANPLKHDFYQPELHFNLCNGRDYFDQGYLSIFILLRNNVLQTEPMKSVSAQFFRRFAFLFLSLAGMMNPALGQLTVGGGTANQLANSLVGPGVVISNITRNCPNGGSGTFNAASTNIAVSDGVLLTSGQITNATTPNTSGSAGTDNNTAGDPDLTALAGVNTFDACALEFDITASCDTIEIAYVFASEEYDEYVCANVNDAFGFFISGPGVPYQNIALIPSTTIPVSINTVNNGTVGAFGSPGPGCVLSNSAYYQSNAVGTTHEYDGMTTRLLAQHWVMPCSTYHIKLVVADGGDGIFDSGVFLEAGGIGCSSGIITVNTAAVNGGNALVEGCNDGILYFQRSGDLTVPLTVNFSVGGTATNGVDYAPVGNSVTFPPLVDSIGIVLNPFTDSNSEGIETILVILSDTVCNTIFSDTAAIIISDPPVADFSVSNACVGVPVAFSDGSSFWGGPISTHAWTFGDGSTSSASNPSHTYTTGGTYQVKLVVTTAQGCKDSIIKPITIFANPTVSFNHLGHCEQNPTQFTDGSNAGSGTLSTWTYNFGDGGSSNQQNPVHTYANAGTYNVSLLVTNSNGCSNSVNVPVTIYDLPEVSFAVTTVCDQSPTGFTDQTVVPGGSASAWAWAFGDGGNSAAQNPLHTYPGPGNYTAHLVVTSNQGCIDSTTRSVTVNPNPVADFISTLTCINDTTRFTDASSILSGSIVSWSWDLGDGTTSTDVNPIHVYPAVGIYSVTLTVVSNLGCVGTVTHEAEVTPGPVMPIPVPDTVCLGEAAELQVIVPNGINVRWYHTKDDSLPFHQGTHLPLGIVGHTQSFYVVAVTPKGCVSDFVPIWVKVWNPINVDISVSDRELEIPTAVVEFGVNPTNGIVSLYWNFGDNSGSNDFFPVHQYSDEGLYTVTLHIVDEHGCERDYELPDWIKVGINVAMFIPNAFTPDGNGVNDEFFITSRLVTDLEIQIFDRWGKLMYISQDLNFRWLGLDAAGVPAPEGVYVYRIRATAYNGEVLDRAGSITLIR